MFTRSLQIHIVKIQRIQHERTHIHSRTHRVKHSGKEDSEFKRCFCFPWQDSWSADVCHSLVDWGWLGLHQARPDRQGEKTVHGRHSSAGQCCPSVCLFTVVIPLQVSVVRLSVCSRSSFLCRSVLSVCLSVHGRHSSSGQCCPSVYLFMVVIPLQVSVVRLSVCSWSSFLCRLVLSVCLFMVVIPLQVSVVRLSVHGRHSSSGQCCPSVCLFMVVIPLQVSVVRLSVCSQSSFLCRSVLSVCLFMVVIPLQVSVIRLSVCPWSSLLCRSVLSVCLSVHGRQTHVCLDKTFVAAKMILVAAPTSDSAMGLTSYLQTDE